MVINVVDSIIKESAFFGVVLSLFAYQFGMFLKKKTKSDIVNPLLVAIVVCIVVLVLFDIDYEQYNNGAKYISFLLTPATVCLAIPLYEQYELLKNNWKAIISGISAGIITNAVSIYLLSLLFGFSHEEYVTFLPKSITTAIGMGISEELGGIVSITVSSIVITGIFGSLIAERIYKILKIKNPIAKGIATGTAAHAMGTSKAMEMGEVEGAMSSLAIVVSGLLTVVTVTGFFSDLI